MEQIKIEQFAILSDNIPDNGFNIETEISFGAVKDQNIICLKLKNSFVSEEKTILTLVISCFFAIHPDSWKECTKDGVTTIGKKKAAHMAMHAFGTARGILFCKTEGTPFQQIILPPTNVEEICKEDFVID